jgi:hypothetical protein
MEYIAKSLEFDVPFYKGPFLCLCVHSEEKELLESIYPAYPVTSLKDQWIELDGKRYRVVAFMSNDSNSVDGEVFNEADLFWCNPKALHSYSKKEYHPIKELLFTQRGGWISGNIHVKRLVYRIL